MKFFLLYLGCQMNQSDSERVKAVLLEQGYEQIETEEQADILGIVACSVRQRAVDRTYGRVHKWNQWKSSRCVVTFITGCILPADRDTLESLFDIHFPIEQLRHLPRMIQQRTSMVGQDGQTPGDFWHIKPHYDSPFEVYIPIQNGCDRFCTFCAVPYTRGREASRASEEILVETAFLLANRCRSITLLGQNVNSYGKDMSSHELNFAGLLQSLAEQARKSGNECWIYFTSPHPSDMTEEVLRVVSQYASLAKQIHLPLQSGDNTVLKRMNRDYRIEQYRQVVEKIRRILPGATLFTDVIVGFPGETQEQFEHTRLAMEELQYNMAYIAMYSPRPGTVSSRWPDDVSADEKNRRFHILSEVLKKHAHFSNSRFIDSICTVLVSGRDRKAGFLSGRTEGRIPVRFQSGDPELIGSFVQVRITSASALSIAGELV